MMLVSYLVRRLPHYGWVVVGITFLALLVSAGVRSAPAVLIVPLEHDFGWSRATISLAVSVNLMLYGLLGPLAATLMERFGIRRTMLFSFAFISVGVTLTTLISASWQMVLLWGIIVGTGTGIISVVLSAIIANRWFAKRRGLVLGLLAASPASGQLVFLPLLALVVERFGWQSAVLAIASVALLLIPIIAVLMRDHPSDVGLKPFGEQTEAIEKPQQMMVNPLVSILRSLKLARQSPNFWLLFFSFFTCGFSTDGLIGTHLIPACIDHGIPEIKAAGFLAIMGIFDFFGTIVSGWLSDRYNSRHLLFWYYALRGLSLLYLTFNFDFSLDGPPLFTIFYGLSWAATVPPTVRLSSNTFGKENTGSIFSWLVAGHQLGASIAAFGAGALRTWLSSYSQAFFLAGVLCLIAAILVLLIQERPCHIKLKTKFN